MRADGGKIRMSNQKQSVSWRKLLSMFLLLAMLFTSIGTYAGNTATVAAATTDEKKTDSEVFDEWTKELFVTAISNDILTNNFKVVDSSKYGVEEVPITLPGYDEESLKASIEMNKEILSFLRGISYQNLTEEQKDLYDLIKFETDTPEEAQKYQYYSKAFGAYSGIQADLMTTLTAYNFDERQDFVDYLKLLQCIPDFFANAITYEQKRSELGLFMSDRELDEVIASMKALIEDPENHVLITTFNHTVDKFGLNNRDTIRFKKQNREIVRNHVIPAYKAAIKELEALRGTGIGSDDGLSALPDGKNYYKYLLKKYSGTNRTPMEYLEIFDQLSEQCLTEIKEISETATLQNFYAPSVKYLTSSPEDYLNLLMENTKEEFPVLDGITFQVSYVDDALGTFVAPAYIMQPQIDATNSFVVNINPAYESSASFDTVAHEGYPGHLYQFVYLNQSNKNPLFHIYDNYGYIEGWANHVQSLSYYYTDCSDLYARYMQLAMNYSTYQIYKLDILINYFGYSKSQAVSYLVDLGYPKETAEYLYYHFITVPAYNMCYAAGQAELELMVNKAQEALGDQFSLKEFHEFYLSMACTTFDTINQRLDEWIATKNK